MDIEQGRKQPPRDAKAKVEQERADKQEEDRTAREQREQTKAANRQFNQDMDMLAARFTNPGMSLSGKGASYAARMKLESEDTKWLLY